MRRRTWAAAPILVLALAGLSGCAAPETRQSGTIATTPGGDRTQVFVVEGMTCATCPIAVKQAMASVAGVRSVSVDFDTKRATVVFDAARATPDAIAWAATDAGYPTRILE